MPTTQEKSSRSATMAMSSSLSRRRLLQKKLMRKCPLFLQAIQLGEMDVAIRLLGSRNVKLAEMMEEKKSVDSSTLNRIQQDCPIFWKAYRCGQVAQAFQLLRHNSGGKAAKAKPQPGQPKFQELRI